MEEVTYTFLSATGLGPIFVREYPVDAPHGIVQICHGMFEHFGRYEAFARFLNQQGYTVVGFDLAGHGISTPDAPRGYFGDGDGFLHLLDDIRSLQQTTAAQNPAVPCFLLGHSMGSFLARSYCARYGQELCGAIFMGSSGMGRLTPDVGRCMLRLFPKKRHLMFFRTMSFAGYNKTYPKPRDTFSWISRDEAAVRAYKADPLRIQTFTARGFYDLMLMLRDISSPFWFTHMPKDLPVLLISGEDDPVGQYGHGVRRIGERLMDAGVRDVNVMLYPSARHEVLNELNRDEVMMDIMAWLHLHTQALPKESGQNAVNA